MIEKLNQTQALAHQLMMKHGLTQDGWRFEFSTSKRRVAVCKFKEKKIEYSMYCIGKTPLSEIRDTILHEIAHALVGFEAGHNHVWKQKCIKIGARPQRLASEVTQNTAKHNYVIKCPTCARQWKRYRLKKSMHGAQCPSCKTVVKIYKVVT